MQRVAELEDLVQEFKNQSSPQDIINYKEVISRQSNQITAYRAKIDELQAVKHQAVDLFEKNELYQTFQKLIDERDDLIKQLVTKL